MQPILILNKLINATQQKISNEAEDLAAVIENEQPNHNLVNNNLVVQKNEQKAIIGESDENKLSKIEEHTFDRDKMLLKQTKKHSEYNSFENKGNNDSNEMINTHNTIKESDYKLNNFTNSSQEENAPKFVQKSPIHDMQDILTNVNQQLNNAIKNGMKEIQKFIRETGKEEQKYKAKEFVSNNKVEKPYTPNNNLIDIKNTNYKTINGKIERFHNNISENINETEKYDNLCKSHVKNNITNKNLNDIKQFKNRIASKHDAPLFDEDNEEHKMIQTKLPTTFLPSDQVNYTKTNNSDEIYQLEYNPETIVLSNGKSRTIESNHNTENFSNTKEFSNNSLFTLLPIGMSEKEDKKKPQDELNQNVGDLNPYYSNMNVKKDGNKSSEKVRFEDHVYQSNLYSQQKPEVYNDSETQISIVVASKVQDSAEIANIKEIVENDNFNESLNEKNYQIDTNSSHDIKKTTENYEPENIYYMSMDAHNTKNLSLSERLYISIEDITALAENSKKEYSSHIYEDVSVDNVNVNNEEYSDIDANSSSNSVHNGQYENIYEDVSFLNEDFIGENGDKIILTDNETTYDLDNSHDSTLKKQKLSKYIDMRNNIVKNPNDYDSDEMEHIKNDTDARKGVVFENIRRKHVLKDDFYNKKDEITDVSTPTTDLSSIDYYIPENKNLEFNNGKIKNDEIYLISYKTNTNLYESFDNKIKDDLINNINLNENSFSNLNAHYNSIESEIDEFQHNFIRTVSGSKKSRLDYIKETRKLIQEWQAIYKLFGKLDQLLTILVEKSYETTNVLGKNYLQLFKVNFAMKEMLGISFEILKTIKHQMEDKNMYLSGNIKRTKYKEVEDEKNFKV